MQEFIGTNKILVRMRTATTMEEKVADRIVLAFNKEFPDNKLMWNPVWSSFPPSARSWTTSEYEGEFR